MSKNGQLIVTQSRNNLKTSFRASATEHSCGTVFSIFDNGMKLCSIRKVVTKIALTRTIAVLGAVPFGKVL